MYLNDYKGFTEKQLRAYFFDTASIIEYGNCINPIYHLMNPFKRVGSHIIFVEKSIIEDCATKGKYNLELIKFLTPILQREKLIKGTLFCPLVDNKTDQTREVIDYIVSCHIKTTVHIYSPDKMFWFFHDMGHGYLSDICDNFYENVYGYPEMLIHIFAAIKLKQYGMYKKSEILHEVIDKCSRYPQEDKEYFISMLDNLKISDDL